MLRFCFVALALLVACPPPPTSACNDDSDCDDDTLCLGGTCVTPDAPVDEREGDTGEGEGEAEGEGEGDVGEGEGDVGEGEGEGETLRCSSVSDCGDVGACLDTSCIDGACVVVPRDCALGCDVALDRCSGCSDHAACADDLFCTTDTCEADGTCRHGPPACGALLCDEAADACIPCSDDGGCDDGDFCAGREACVDGRCVSGLSEPCDVDGCDDNVDCGSIGRCAQQGCIPVAWLANRPNNIGGQQNCLVHHRAGQVGANNVGWDDLECAANARGLCTAPMPGATAFADFFVADVATPFADVESACLAAGGALVTDRTLQRHHDVAAAAFAVGDVWLGARRIGVLAEFRWLDDDTTVPLRR